MGQRIRNNFNKRFERSDPRSLCAKNLRFRKTNPERKALQGDDTSAVRYFRQRTDAKRGIRAARYFTM